MELSQRLRTIFNLVEPCKCVVDVGSDHAYIPIALIESGICAHVIACDINEKPLNNALCNVSKAAFEECISMQLSDGLKDIEEAFDGVIIAGMGYESIINIIEDSFAKFRNAKQIIIQSNTHVPKVRQWMLDQGFYLDREDMVFEGHYYFALSYHYGQDDLNDNQILFGKYLDAHPLFKEYWNKQLASTSSILEQLDDNNPSYSIHKGKYNQIINYLNNKKDD